MAMADEKGSILVIDDDEIIRKSCERILSSEGYTLELSGNPTEGLNRLRKKAFDLVLTDLTMPGMSGLEVLKDIREAWPDTEVIVVSGFGTAKMAVEALRYGAYDFIEKPFTPEQLTNLVSRCIERKRLFDENLRLKQEVHSLFSVENVIGASPAMQRVLQLVLAVAPTDTTVLISGESGTGKELLARAIHLSSPFRDEPFVVVDCIATPDDLLGAELFGQAKGSPGTAHEPRAGLMELAGKGTLLFDEIGSLSAAMQARLLRVLQQREFRAAGGKNVIRMDARVIAVTNRDLSRMATEGAFREDLFYLLNVFPIHLPPLRERREDIPALTEHFLRRYSNGSGMKSSPVSPGALKRLILYDWPGNVRELENVVHRAVILSKGKTVRPEHILITGKQGADVPRTSKELKAMKKELRVRSVTDLERAFVIAALERAQWNATKAAKDVGMQRTNFQALLRRHGIRREPR